MVVTAPKMGKIGDWTKITEVRAFIQSYYQAFNETLQVTQQKNSKTHSEISQWPGMKITSIRRDGPILQIAKTLWPAGASCSGASLQVETYFT